MTKAKKSVFLNIPYDPRFSNQYLAYITAFSALSLVPRATLGIAGNRRLDRIAHTRNPYEYGNEIQPRIQFSAATLTGRRHA